MSDDHETQPIQAGDVIDVLYTERGHNLIKALTVYVPQSDGDYWHIFHNGSHHEINPRNAMLKGFRHYRGGHPEPAHVEAERGEEAGR